MTAVPSTVLDDLKRRIAPLRGGERAVLPFGVEAIDRHLPGGGLMLGALHEVAGGAGDAGHGAAATLFVAGILARLDGPVLWCLERQDLFAPALAAVGLHPGRVIVAEVGKARAVLAAMEEGARQAGLAGVVGEVRGLDLTASRRLALAAEGSGAVVFALACRPAARAAPGRKREGTGGEETRGEGMGREGVGRPSAAVTRWRIAPAAGVGAGGGPAGGPGDVRGAVRGGGERGRPGLGRALWTVELTRCRGAEAAVWMLGACDGEGRLAHPGANSAASPALASPGGEPREIGAREIGAPGAGGGREGARAGPVRDAAAAGADARAVSARMADRPAAPRGTRPRSRAG